MAGGDHHLDVWLDGVRVADLYDVWNDLPRLTYVPETIAAHGNGAILLSVSLPVRAAPYPPALATPYLEGLLPEDGARTRIENRLGVRRGDLFGLLRTIGGDCPGAVAFLPRSEVLGGSLDAVVALDEAELAARLRALSVMPLGVDARVRLSLGGMQHKLPLVGLSDDRWGRPVDGAPSTHILKPDAKYEQSGGPGFSAIAGVLRKVGTRPAVELVGLLRAMVLTVIIGNADAHARNLSLRHEGGRRGLAPLYDLVPTAHVVPRAGPALSTSLAMSVNGVRDIHDVARADLIAEARAWRLPSATVVAEVDRLLSGATEAIMTAAQLVDGVPAAVVRSMLERVAALRDAG